jgi:citrate lyase subunit beta / citryl-CoA lyase
VTDLRRIAWITGSRAGADLVVMPAIAMAPPGGTKLYVEIGPPGADGAAEGLAAAMRRSPAGLLVAGIADGRALTLLDARIAVAEAELGRTAGETTIIAVAGSTPQALLAIETLVGATPRLAGLVHDPLPLRHALGDAEAPDLVRLARALTVAAAHAAGVPAIDADPSKSIEEARRDGFSARLVASD